MFDKKVNNNTRKKLNNNMNFLKKYSLNKGPTPTSDQKYKQAVKIILNQYRSMVNDRSMVNEQKNNTTKLLIIPFG